MNNRIHRVTAPLLLSVVALAAAVAPAADVADDRVELEPLVVTPGPEPLDDASQLLRALVERSAPCLGCDAVLVARRATLLDLLLAPRPLPEPDEAARVALEVKLQDSPDLEYLRP